VNLRIHEGALEEMRFKVQAEGRKGRIVYLISGGREFQIVGASTRKPPALKESLREGAGRTLQNVGVDQL
jgi:hypothetical protein